MPAGAMLSVSIGERRVADRPLGGNVVTLIQMPGGGSLTGPTVKSDDKPLLEVFIFDFDQPIYGRRIAVEFLHKLRDEARYPDLAALTQQIRTDAEQARAYFAAH